MGCSNGGSIAYRFACNRTAAALIDAVTIACQSWCALPAHFLCAYPLLRRRRFNSCFYFVCLDRVGHCSHSAVHTLFFFFFFF